MNRLAVFDCDGTLVDSGATIHAALRQTFVQHGAGRAAAEHVAAGDRAQPDRSHGRAGAGQGRRAHQQLAEDYKLAFQQLRAAGKVEEPLFDGVIELLDTLEQDGWLLAVATGKSDRGLKHCLEQHGLHARFVSLQTADRHPSKPHPSMVEQAIADAGAAPATTIVVGDTSFDMAMAAAAGAAGIGAGWGYHDAGGADRSWGCRGCPGTARRARLSQGPRRWMTPRLATGSSRTPRFERPASASSFSASPSSTVIGCAGGWPQVGAIVAIMGVIDALFAPRLLKRAWDERDRERP